jgi:TonB family protein
MALFYLLYLLLLKNETFYKTNRFFLLGGLILAFLLPMFPISIVSPIAIMNNSEFFSLAEYSGMVQMQGAGEMQAQQSAADPWWNLIVWVYLAGLTLFLVRLVWQTLGILWKIRHLGHQIIYGVKVIDWKSSTPFSFFNVVFIDIQEYSERELSNIIAHEKVHIRERHWVDLLIIELLAVLFWMNPVVWLYEKSIKQNHEYLADQGVLLAGYSPGQYQALLINQLMGVKVLGFAHNLNFSLNKKRMDMMKKEKSPGASKMKLLLALPVVALLVFAFAKKEFATMNADNESAFSSYTGKNQILNQVNLEDLIKLKGVVVNSEGLPMTGANVILNDTNTGTVVDEKGAFELDAPEEFSLVISFIGYKTVINKYSFLDKSNAFVKIKMEEGIFNIDLPDIGDGEHVTNGELVEDPPPPPPPKKGRKGEVFSIVEDMPVYKNGGMYKLAQDISDNTVSIMKKTSDRGKSVVGFTVGADGKVTNAHIVQSANSTILDESALQIVQKLDNWNPGVQRGKPVKVNLNVPVYFN